MKGIVLAGGKGSRLRPFTYSGAKQLVPIANTPVLHFPVRQLVAAGITEIAIVVGESADQVCAAMGNGSQFGARFTYIAQPKPLGIAHAVLLAREFIGRSRFALYLGDNVLRNGIVDFVTAFLDRHVDGAVILKEVADPGAFGVARLAGRELVEVIEKPIQPPSSLAVTGVYAFSPEIFDVIARQQPSARGELEIADAINGLIALGKTVSATITTDDWIDTGKMDDLLAANRIALADLDHVRDPEARIVRSRVMGQVTFESGVCIEDCHVVGPVAVAEGTHLIGCQIGPNVSIGAGCDLREVTVANSIIMDRAVLSACPGIIDSMIGRDALVEGVPAGSRLTLGDHSRVEGRL